MVPEDRKELGLILCRSILENIALPNLACFSKRYVVDRRHEEKEWGKLLRNCG